MRASGALIGSEQLTGGDPRLLRNGARIGVRSFHRAAGRQPVSFALDVLYETENGTVPFHAWSYTESGSGSVSAAQRVTFNAPVDALSTLDFVVRRGEESQTLRFSVHGTEGTIPLRPGVYFIALYESAGEPRVQWNGISLRDGKTPGGAEDVLASVVFGEEREVPFNYVTISVETAP